MSTPENTLWRLRPHTRVKHLILRRYLEAWLPIMARFQQKILYVDGFAGPGRYIGGEEGSPLIALRTLLTHSAFKTPGNREVEFLFVEGNELRATFLATQLKEFTKEIPPPPWVKYTVAQGEFHRVIGEKLDQIARSGASFPPTFAFVDPFGYARVPLEVIAGIVRQRHCECLINFMFKWILRAGRRREARVHEQLDNYFDSPDWRLAFKEADPPHRRDALVNLYRHQLETRAGLRYVRTFVMIDKLNQPRYFLFFGTNNPKGLSEMKRAMWKADPGRGEVFSDRTDPQQMVLFGSRPDFGALGRLLVRRFKPSGPVTIDEIIKFVRDETPFSEVSHLKAQTLKPLEVATPSVIEVQRPPGAQQRVGTYPSGTIIQFR